MLPVLDQASYAAKEITFKTPTKVNADSCLMFEALIHRVQTLIRFYRRGCEVWLKLRK